MGLRPISALVDATNLIAQDRGRPLHVFDAGKAQRQSARALAKDGEKVLALDDKTYTLDAEMIVIADDAAARGIAGVMGGEDSSCTEATTDVFIESAWFDPARIARTGRKLGDHLRCALSFRARRRSANSCCRGWSLRPG